MVAPSAGDGSVVSIHGLRFWLFGFEFTLLAPGPEPRAVDALHGQAYRPAALMVEGSGVCIRFAWNDGPGSRGLCWGESDLYGAAGRRSPKTRQIYCEED